MAPQSARRHSASAASRPNHSVYQLSNGSSGHRTPAGLRSSSALQRLNRGPTSHSDLGAPVLSLAEAYANAQGDHDAQVNAAEDARRQALDNDVVRGNVARQRNIGADAQGKPVGHPVGCREAEAWNVHPRPTGLVLHAGMMEERGLVSDAKAGVAVSVE